MSAGVYELQPFNNDEVRTPGLVQAEALNGGLAELAVHTDAQVISINALSGQEDAAIPLNPFADLAKTAVEGFLADRKGNQPVRVGHLLGRAFGGVKIADTDRHAFYDALATTPGVTYLGDGHYQVERPLMTEGLEQSKATPVLAQQELPPEIITLADIVINGIKPGKPFTGGLLINRACNVKGNLTRAEIAQFFKAAESDPRLISLGDNTYTLKNEETPPEEPGHSKRDIALAGGPSDRPYITSENVVSRATLNGMMKVALRPGPTKKPRHKRKHTGWKRVGNMDDHTFQY